MHSDSNGIAVCNLNTMTHINTYTSISGGDVRATALFPVPNSSPYAVSVFVLTTLGIEYWTITETSPNTITVTKNSQFLVTNITDICGVGIDTVLYAWNSGGLGTYNFTTPSFNHLFYATDLKVLEVGYVNGYLVFTDGYYFCFQPIADLYTLTLQNKYTLPQMGIGNSLNLTNIQISDIPVTFVDTVVSFSTGDGIAKYDLVAKNVTEQFKSRDYPELANLTGYSPTAFKLVGLGVNNYKVPFINFQYASLYTYAGHEMISQKLPIDNRYPYKGVKLSIVVPDSSTFNGDIKIYDDNNQGIFQLAIYTFLNGVISGSTTKICYFDAPIGITTRAFFVSIISNVSNEEIKIYMDEV
jgi:hypothetical protein